MSDHYYSEKPTVESDVKEWSVNLKGKDFLFASDRGVFSKEGIDFGSRLLIETFEMPSFAGDIVDVGCGYGPIGLSVASMDSSRVVHMVDVNERALALAKDNAKRNRCGNVEIYKSDCLTQVKGTFAAIVTNPPIRAGKKVVHTIFEQASSLLREQGELWVVIQKKQGAPSAIERLKQLFNSVEVVVKKKGYFILLAKKV
ncbi:class I SAM-dependent methyltransferase [Halalkalibacter hemicellulosilyticus]|uniref:Ribosomal RNA small subunit methyltransferase C n=1 Tax=Halalkalibacter hemicellulosilyticusJCM 9152 TaxID=1236971 RepID=W4QIL6_9BACI|nr:class I SAM-dependent methyltransferase [Halalkalibacter hemicellulosilyticus]GAE31478.1 ribosomal RNA small subunit methyltransferase C [Halalkalibacter hemicellulosilyticusJCM 9152]